MRKLLAAVALGFVLGGATAFAAVQPWKVVKQGSATSEYAVANVSVTIKSPQALAVRSMAGSADLTWSFNCSGVVQAKKGAVYVLAPAKAQDCTVAALGSASRRVTVQVLAKK